MNWINIKDRVPDKLQKILFLWRMDNDLRNVSMGFRDDKGWLIYLPYTSYYLNPEFIEVTHWMELPKYPNE